jgi:hypothetical protein
VTISIFFQARRADAGDVRKEIVMSEPSSKSLPLRPSLEHLRKQAKDLLKACHGGDASARTRLQQHKPKVTEPVLADAQFALAREYGFASWPRLVHYVEAANSPDVVHQVDWSARRIEPRQRLSARDWDAIIDVIRECSITGVDARGQMTDAVLERLSHFDHITSLRLGGSKQLTDDGVLHLARMPQLVELDLSDHPGGRVTDRGLQVLRQLPALRRFQMCWQSGISDAGVANLAFCSRLEQVDLLGSPTGDGAIKALCGKPHLRQFKTGRLVTDAGLTLLHDFPVFKTWQGGEPRYDLMSFGNTDPNFLMLDGPFSNEGLAGLEGLEGLFGLGFFWHVSEVTADSLKLLAKLPNLGALACEGELCDDVAMRHIASAPRLRMLMAQGTVASDDGFAALSRSPSIEYIWGRECPNLHDRGFRALADMPALEGLAVSCKFVEDQSLAYLPRFPALKWLLPMDVHDEGFRHVGRCERLEKLTCMYCRDTGDRATECIAGLAQLKHYYAGKTQITDRSLEILGGMTSLEEVQLSACANISDAGLVHIARLPRLRKVSVDATNRVTRAGIVVFPASVHVDFWS